VSLSDPSVGKRQVEIREVRETTYQFLCSPLNGGLRVNVLIQSGTPLFYQTERKGLASHVLGWNQGLSNYKAGVLPLDLTVAYSDDNHVLRLCSSDGGMVEEL
jgi:hypothetical protein